MKHQQQSTHTDSAAINLAAETMTHLGLAAEKIAGRPLRAEEKAPCYLWGRHAWRTLCRENFPDLPRGYRPTGFVDSAGNIHLLQSSNPRSPRVLRAYLEEQAHVELGFGKPGSRAGSNEFFTKLYREAKLGLVGRTALPVEEIMGEVVAHYSHDPSQVLRSWRCALRLTRDLDIARVFASADALRRQSGRPATGPEERDIYKRARCGILKRPWRS